MVITTLMAVIKRLVMQACMWVCMCKVVLGSAHCFMTAYSLMRPVYCLLSGNSPHLARPRSRPFLTRIMGASSGQKDEDMRLGVKTI